MGVQWPPLCCLQETTHAARRLTPPPRAQTCRPGNRGLFPKVGGNVSSHLEGVFSSHSSCCKTVAQVDVRTLTSKNALSWDHPCKSSPKS